MLLFAPNQAEKFLEQPEDWLNILSMAEANCIPHIFQVSNGKWVSQHKFFPLNFEDFDGCRSNMLPTNMSLLGSQMAAANADKVSLNLQPWLLRSPKSMPRKERHGTINRQCLMYQRILNKLLIFCSRERYSCMAKGVSKSAKMN